MPKSNRLVFLVAVGLGCGGAPAEPSPPVGTLEIMVPASELRPGRVMQAQVLLRSPEGDLVPPAAVTWRSLTPAVLQVDSAGHLQALAPGTGVVRATAGRLAAELTIALRNPATRTLVVEASAIRLSLPSESRLLSVTPRDSVGEPIVGGTVRWSSSAPRIAAVTALGQVTAVAAGRTRVIAEVDGVTASIEVSVVADPLPTAPIIDAIAPNVIVPGQTLVVNGSLFASTSAGNVVVLDGIPLTVTQASSTRLVLAVPAASNFACTPRRSVALQISTAGGIGVAEVPLEVATTRSIARGESLILSSAAAHCLDLSSAPGRYRLAVTNVARAIGAPLLDAMLTGVVRSSTAALAMGTSPGMMASAPRREDRLADVAAHLTLLEANRRAIEGVIGGAAEARATRSRRDGLRQADPPRLVEPRRGDLRAVRLPALGQPDLCVRFTPITARVAWVGRRITILEDTTTILDGVATLAGTQDALFASVGAELDSLGWSIARLFGDPLVMDGRLDDDGRVAIVVTPQMNAALGGRVLAATTTCDYFPRAQFAASDMGEMIYAQAPTRAVAGDVDGSPTRWRRVMRATLIHELKHVVAYAERIVRGQPLEESWLEEGTARLAEERFARAIYGIARHGNIPFAASLACEISGSSPGCGDAPLVMRPHFDALYEAVRAPTLHSPLGPTAAGDVTFYGAAWALIRWAIDAQALEEPTTFAALVTSGQSGLANLEARVQRPWEDLLPEWALTLMVDDVGLTVPTRLTFPSWDLRSQFRGLCETIGQCAGGAGDPRFPRRDPVQALSVEPASLARGIDVVGPSVSVGAIVPGGFAPIDLHVADGATAVIGVTTGSAAPAPTLRLALVRIE